MLGAGVRLLVDTADHIDPTARTVTLGSGAAIGYDYLVYAVGSTGAVASVPAFVAQINVMKPYITSNVSQIGAMDESHVLRCISVLESAGLIPSGLEPDAILGEQTLMDA